MVPCLRHKTCLSYPPHQSQLLLIFAALPLALLAFWHCTRFFIPHLQGWGEYLWEVNYSHGFVKRGLLGHFLGIAGGDLQPQMRAGAAVLLYRVTFTCFFSAIVCWSLREILRGTADGAIPVVPTGLFLSLLFTPLWPTLAWLVGYPDLFLMCAVLLGFLAWQSNRLALLASIVVAGPAMHEGFVFLWSTVCLLAFATTLHSHSRLAMKTLCVTSVLPAISFVVVRFLHDNDALTAALNAAHFSDRSMVKPLYDGQFNQQPWQMLEIMMGKFALHSDTVLLVGIYSCLIPLLIISLIAIAGRRAACEQLTLHGFLSLALAVAAAVAPVSVLLFAWDLSRLLNYFSFSTMLVLLYAIRAGWLQGLENIYWRCTAATVLAISILFYVGTPLPYAYFEHTYLVGPQGVTGIAGRIAIALADAVNASPVVAPGNAR